MQDDTFGILTMTGISTMTTRLRMQQNASNSHAHFDSIFDAGRRMTYA
jgi:hypothetical protein